MTATLALIVATTSLVFTLLHVYILVQLCQRVIDVERKLVNARVSISEEDYRAHNGRHSHRARINFH